MIVFDLWLVAVSSCAETMRSSRGIGYAGPKTSSAIEIVHLPRATYSSEHAKLLMFRFGLHHQQSMIKEKNLEVPALSLSATLQCPFVK